MYRGRPWTIRQYAGFASAEESNARYRYLLERGQTGLSVAFDLPTQLGYDSDDPRAVGEVGPHRRRDRLARRHGAPVRRDPARRGLDVDDDQRAGVAPPSALRARRREAGRRGEALRGTVQNDILKEYIARGNYIFPPKPVDAADDRSVRVLRGADPEAGTRSRSPGTTSARPARPPCRSSRSRSRTGSPTARPPSPPACRPTTSASASPSSSTRTTTSSRRWRSSAPRGGSGRASCASASARRIRRRWRPALPRADRRLDAHRAAARQQHRARRDPGAFGRLRRRAVAAHELVRRGARAADRALGAKVALRTQQILAAEGGAAPTPPTRSAARTSSRR